MRKKAVLIHEKDNVVTCVHPIAAGTDISFFQEGKIMSLSVREDIPLGHKVAIRFIAKGKDIIKYAESIGSATIDIEPGQHVHVHNIESKRGRGDLDLRRT